MNNSSKKLKITKPTVKRTITSREGLCLKTNSDAWMHEDVLEKDRRELEKKQQIKK